MIRILFVVALLALVIATATWFADHPGAVRIEWQGYQIRMTVSVLAALVGVTCIIAALVYRLWWGLRRMPRLITVRRHEGRRRRGTRALTQGLLAAAAGDARETQRYADKAAALRANPALTLLLSAQAAQLCGDEEVAASFYSAMLDKPEMAFLGLRGLIGRALCAGREEEARALIEKAQDLHPKTPWVANALLNLQARAGKWEQAEETLKQARRLKAVPTATARKWLAIILLEQSRQAESSGQSIAALSLAERAWKQDSDLVVLAVHLAGLLSRSGRHRRARNIIHKLWRKAPHPELAAAYATIGNVDDPLARARHFKKLDSFNPGHPESQLALARMALDAGLWGEARTHLDSVADVPSPSRRACSMLSELEECGNGNPTRARQWRERAAQAGSDAAWICGQCAAAVDVWTSRCSRCGAFAVLEWCLPGADRDQFAVGIAAPLFPAMAVPASPPPLVMTPD